MEYNLNTRASAYALPDPIQVRAEEMFFPKDGEKPDLQKPGLQGQKGLLGTLNDALGAIPGYNFGTQQLVDAGLTKLRQGKVKSLAEGVGMAESYDGEANKYGNLSDLDRLLYGVLDDDITKGLVNQQARGVSNSDDAKALRKLLGSDKAREILSSKGKLTDTYGIEKTAEEVVAQKNLTTSIEGKVKGKPMLAKAIADNDGKPLSSSQLRALEIEVEQEQPKNVRDQETHKDNLKSSKTRREVARSDAEANTATAAANTLTAQTNRITAINNQRLAEAEMAFKQQQLAYNRDVAMYGINAKAREAGLDRDLRKDLAVLGLQDKRADRRYNRERDERKDRQMMIMQLLGGLKNLGSAFAL